MADEPRVRHCGKACTEHGHWCVSEGPVHDTHRTELCRCVWDAAGKPVLELDAVVEWLEEQFPRTSSAEQSTEAETKEGIEP